MSKNFIEELAMSINYKNCREENERLKLENECLREKIKLISSVVGNITDLSILPDFKINL